VLTLLAFALLLSTEAGSDPKQSILPVVVSLDLGPGPFFTRDENVEISGWLTPDLGGYGLLARVNGVEAPVSVESDGSFSFQTPLRAGENAISFQATSPATHQQSAPVSITVHSGQPAPGAVDLAEAQHLFQVGCTLHKGGDVDEEIEAFTRLIHVDPLAATGFSGRAAAHVRRDEFKPAFEDASRAVELDPRDFAAWSHRTHYLMQENKNEEAIASATRAIELKPALVVPYSNRARARLELEQYAGAVADATKAIELGERSGYALWVRAAAYEGMGLNQKALDDTAKALEIDPAAVAALWVRAQVLGRMGNDAGAIETYTKLISADRDRAFMHYNSRAWLRYKKGDYERAIDDATKSIEVSANPHAYGTRAWARHARGDSNGALEDLARATGLEKAYSGIDLDQGLGEYIRGNDARAIELWEKALAGDDTDADAVAVTPLLEKARKRLER
jgi:Tfp pilus assembly protein PilF